MSLVTFWRSGYAPIISALGLFAFLAATGAAAQPADDEPIAYVGHGTFFDSKGNQIPLTQEFVARALKFYGDKLQSGLNRSKKTEFANVQKRLNEGVTAEGQDRLVLQRRSLDWLVENAAGLDDAGRTRGKLNALKYALGFKIPERVVPEQERTREPFKPNLPVERKLNLKLMDLAPGNVQVLSATINAGQAYINECAAAGVPIPPPIGQLDPAGTAGWKTQGFIPTNQQFIGQGSGPSPAEVRTFQSSSPAGMCIALPRYSDTTKTTVSLDGVICVGKLSSKVCFWDNQMAGNGFSFPAGTKIPIGVPDLSVNPAGLYQAGGFELNNGSGGVCTDCHAGANPYIIHPRVDLGGGLLMGDLGDPPLNLPTFPSDRYDPLVPSAWPQNQLSHSPALVPSACIGCHDSGSSAGAFPHLSNQIQGYCGTILAQAIAKTMPPGNPGGLANDPDVKAFQAWCSSAPSAGPSDRGDPHLTTTNGINYDFQAAGEFTTLRNSATQFELQTRQTPVSTSFTPEANPYTGLASCVSLNTAAAVRIGKHRITYQPGVASRTKERMELRIDGGLTTVPPRGLDLGNGNRIAGASSGGGLDIRASDGTNVLITPTLWESQGYAYLNIEVVNTPAREGTMGHIPDQNWLPLAPDGSSFGPAPGALSDRYSLLNQKFADAWRVSKKTSLFDYPDGSSTDDFTDRNWPPESQRGVCKAAIGTTKFTKAMKPEAARRLCRPIEDKTVFENCVLDLTATGETRMLQAYLQTLKLRENAQ